MNINQTGLSQIFTSNIFLEIPFFQRSYVWGQTQWERMLNDAEEVCKNKKPYFAGTIILKAEDESKKTVVDGQQRLTTLFILEKVIDLAKNTDSKNRFDQIFRNNRDNYIALIHNYNDKFSFNKIMNLEQLVDLRDLQLHNQDEKDSNIYDAYDFFKKHISQDVDKFDVDSIGDNFKFALVDVQADEDEQQIFDTINSTGVLLTTAELLKNYFYSNGQVDKYEDEWYRIFEKDDEARKYWDTIINIGPNKKRTFIDIFFHTFLQIKIQDKKIGVSSSDKEKLSKDDSLFASYKYFIATYMNNDRDVLLNEIWEYVQIFRETFSLDYIDHGLPSKPGLERMNFIIFFLDNSPLIRYILYVEKNANNQDKKYIYAVLESYIMRRTITRASTKNNGRFYGSLISSEVLNKKQLESYIAVQKGSEFEIPDDESVIKAIHEEEKISNDVARGILYMLESKWRDDEMDSTSLYGISHYSLEHMMPKKWRNHWDSPNTLEEIEKRDKMLKTLGNLAIISNKLNQSISDSDWETKKEYGLIEYAAGIKTYFGALDESVWNEEKIYERADKLAGKALAYWPFSYNKGKLSSNSSVEHFVDMKKPDNYGKTTVVSFQFEGKDKVQVRNWTDLYVKVVNCLDKEHPGVINKFINKNISGGNSKKIEVSDDKERIKGKGSVTVKTLDNGLYIYTNYSPQAFIKKIIKLLEIYNYPSDSLKIFIL